MWNVGGMLAEAGPPNLPEGCLGPAHQSCGCDRKDEGLAETFQFLLHLENVQILPTRLRWRWPKLLCARVHA